MERVAVIMGGGRGERLWPKSRKEQPKQFLSLGGDNKSLVVQAVERMKKLTGINNVFIVTGRDYFEITRKQLPELPVENIICEPMGKNTTACIGYACQIIKNEFNVRSKKEKHLLQPNNLQFSASMPRSPAPPH
jgi:mannose-1-phosphate guanylyltransferase